MAMIKHAKSTQASRDAIVLNLGDLRMEAERMREAALAERDRIIADAKSERDRIMAGASEAGYDAGYAEGLTQGRSKGEEQGMEQAYAECAERVKGFEQSLQDSLEGVDRERATCLREAKTDLLLFACAFAERVTKKMVELDPGVIDAQLDASLKLVLGSTRLHIAIHPDDRAVCERVAPVLARRRVSESPVQFIEDAAIGRGSVVVRTDKGVIDATIESQIERMVSSLLGSERLADRLGERAEGNSGEDAHPSGDDSGDGSDA